MSAGDITAGLQQRVNALRKKLEPTEVDQFQTDSLELFKSLSTSIGSFTVQDTNDLVVYIVDITDQSANLNPELILEGWKLYVRLLKSRGHEITRNSCSIIAECLSKMISDGISGVLSSPNEMRMSLLFFYLQRLSATLSICIHALDEAKIFDLFYMLCAARGSLQILDDVAFGASNRLDIAAKMNSNFLKSLMHPVTHECERHHQLFLHAIDPALSSKSIWATLPHMPYCWAVGSCQLLLHLAQQSESLSSPLPLQPCLHIFPDLLKTILVLQLSVPICHSLVDTMFSSLLFEISEYFARAISSVYSSGSENERNSGLIDLLGMFQEAQSTDPVHNILYELIYCRVISLFDDVSQGNMLRILRKLLDTSDVDTTSTLTDVDWSIPLRRTLMSVNDPVRTQFVDCIILEEARSHSSVRVNNSSEQLLDCAISGNVPLSQRLFLYDSIAKSLGSHFKTSFPSIAREGFSIQLAQFLRYFILYWSRCLKILISFPHAHLLPDINSGV